MITAALCIASFTVGFVAACVFAMSGRMSDIEDREQQHEHVGHIQ